MDILITKHSISINLLCANWKLKSQVLDLSKLQKMLWMLWCPLLNCIVELILRMVLVILLKGEKAQNVKIVVYVLMEYKSLFLSRIYWFLNCIWILLRVNCNNYSLRSFKYALIHLIVSSLVFITVYFLQIILIKCRCRRFNMTTSQMYV